MKRHSIRRHLPTLFALIVAGTLPLTAAAFQGPRDLPDFARDAWAATVLVETRTWQHGSGDRNLHTGSGVVIAHDLLDGTLTIATSGHVVPCDAACLVRVALPAIEGGGRPLTVRAHLAWHDSRQDLALLRATLPTGAAVRVARLATTPAAGARVLAIGYPDPALLGDRPATARAKLFSGGRLLKTHHAFEADYRAYASTAIDGHLAPEGALLHTAELLPGSSGGPLIDATGAVVGINSGSLVPARGGGCVRAGVAGERCLHLAVVLGTVLEQILQQEIEPSASSTASAN